MSDVLRYVVIRAAFLNLFIVGGGLVGRIIGSSAGPVSGFGLELVGIWLGVWVAMVISHEAFAVEIHEIEHEGD